MSGLQRCNDVIARVYSRALRLPIVDALSMDLIRIRVVAMASNLLKDIPAAERFSTRTSAGRLQ